MLKQKQQQKKSQPKEPQNNLKCCFLRKQESTRAELISWKSLFLVPYGSGGIKAIPSIALGAARPPAAPRTPVLQLSPRFPHPPRCWRSSAAPHIPIPLPASPLPSRIAAEPPHPVTCGGALPAGTSPAAGPLPPAATSEPRRQRREEEEEEEGVGRSPSGAEEAGAAPLAQVRSISLSCPAKWAPLCIPWGRGPSSARSRGWNPGSIPLR